jgi:transcriptional regulator EpsA
MSLLAGLGNQDLEHLALTIETSLQVNRRFQFFLWAQGALQGFVPHETLLCAYGDIGRLRVKCDYFSRAIIEPRFEEQLLDPVNGLLPKMVGDWLANDRQPQVYGQVRDDDGSERIEAQLERYDLGRVLAHGAREVQGQFGSFFAFLKVPRPIEPRDAYMIEVLMPHLHMALHRMLATESSDAPSETRATAVLSARQLQVLEWVRDGKTNPEIASILGISPATVKNHVQKVLHKLNVRNRAQAVARGGLGRYAPLADESVQSSDCEG